MKTADEVIYLIGVLHLSYNRRITVDIEFLLARHPYLFLWRKCRIECLNSGGILTAVGGSRGDVHPLSAVKIRCKLFSAHFKILFSQGLLGNHFRQDRVCEIVFSRSDTVFSDSVSRSVCIVHTKIHVPVTVIT